MPTYEKAQRDLAAKMMSKVLRVSETLSLPLELGSQAAAIFGIRGSGKTNTAGVLAEELLKADQPIAVVDPTDAWWGLRSSRDGKREGFEVFIFGGTHGDLPLSENDGKVVAEFLVQERVPVVLSLRHLRKGGQRKFVTELCEELYHLKGRQEYRSPLTVFIDEAPLFVPQRVTGEMARTVGAVEDLVARGRNAGFGVVLISQRPATLNADVRSICDTIIAHRVTGPLDRKAFSLWIEENATIEEHDEVLKSLATLKNGEAWVWAPVLGVMQRVGVRLRASYDSSATPKPGQKVAPPKKLAEIDKDKLKGRLAAAVEKAKEEDPRELRRRVKDLEAQVLKATAATPAPSAPAKLEVKRVDVPVLKDGQLKRLEGLGARAEKLVRPLVETLQAFRSAADEIGATARRVIQPAVPAGGAVPLAPAASARLALPTKPVQPRRLPAPQAGEPAGDFALTTAHQRIIDSLAWWEVIGVTEPDKGVVAVMAGYTVNGHFRNMLGGLRTAGLLDYPDGGKISLTDAGQAAAAYPSVPGTLAEVHAAWKAKLSDSQWKIVAAVMHAHPTPLSSEEVAQQAGYTVNGHFRNMLGSLRSLGIVTKKGPVAATALLYPPGL